MSLLHQRHQAMMRVLIGTIIMKEVQVNIKMFKTIINWLARDILKIQDAFFPTCICPLLFPAMNLIIVKEVLNESLFFC